MRACRRIILGAAVVAAGLGVSTAWATMQPAPAEPPLTRFAAHDAGSSQTYGYVLWRRILDTVLMPDGGVDYGALGIAGREALDSVVVELTSTPVSTLGRDEQLAFWLNLYNAAQLRLMIDQFMTLGSSQRDFAGRNPYAEQMGNGRRVDGGKEYPWTARNLAVEGTSLSLNDIEHRILHAQWPDDPVAYGLSCPLRGCPPLRAEPFLGALVHRQLRDAAARFIADDRNVSIKGEAVTLSQLYRQPAFGGDAQVLEHLRRYADETRRQQLAAANRVAGHAFDWKLAGRPPPASARLPQGQINRGAGAGGQLQD